MASSKLEFHKLSCTHYCIDGGVKQDEKLKRAAAENWDICLKWKGHGRKEQQEEVDNVYFKRPPPLCPFHHCQCEARSGPDMETYWSGIHLLHFSSSTSIKEGGCIASSVASGGKQPSSVDLVDLVWSRANFLQLMERCRWDKWKIHSRRRDGENKNIVGCWILVRFPNPHYICMMIMT